MSRITVHKRNDRGVKVWEYSGEVVERGPTWVCLRARYNGPESDVSGIVFRHGDVMTEWFYGDRWYNVFRVEDGDSARVKGWYCNITRPTQIGEALVSADDLALDVVILPAGDVLLLDEDEFDALDIPVDDRAAALAAVEQLRDEVAARRGPFETLGQAGEV